MKMVRTLCLCGAVVLPQLALAELPVSKQALGQGEAAIDFCSKGKPEVAAKLKPAAKALIGNATKKEIDDARNSDEYKDGYSSISASLGKMSKTDAAQACSDLIQANK